MAGAVGRLLMRCRVDGAARIRMTGPCGATGPILVQVNTQAMNTPIRVQCLTRGRGDALPVLLRLERQLRTARGTWTPRPWPDPARLPLDSSGRGILLRRKTPALRTTEPLNAAIVMNSMDYDVHLFTDSETAEDAIVYRAQPSGLRLARQHRVHPPSTATVGAARPGPLITTSRPAPVRTESEAVGRLCRHGLPFLFYTDRNTGRGFLMYRRYDNDLGLIAPVRDTVAPWS